MLISYVKTTDSYLHIVFFFRLPCSLVDRELACRISTSKGSWGEVYHHVVRVHMNRASSGTFHSHNFNTVMACVLRDMSKQLVWLLAFLNGFQCEYSVILHVRVMNNIVVIIFIIRGCFCVMAKCNFSSKYYAVFTVIPVWDKNLQTFLFNLIILSNYILF